MPPPDERVLLLTGPRGPVRRAGERMGAAAQPGDVIALVGGLGAGKTFLSQAIARGAGVPREVRVASPTFTIMQRYDGRIPVYHADLYRLDSVRDVDETGLFAQGREGLVIVEWADRFPTAVPATTLWVDIEKLAPLRRALYARGEGEPAARLMAAARAPDPRARVTRARAPRGE